MLDTAISHGLSASEYERIVTTLGRTPNLVELGIFSVMWSEHCSYKSTRLHLKKLPTEGECVICGPGENAGVIDIGDGLAAIFKIESHNHPSFIEPYQGAATGVGGILRDVFTMGARPIANLNSLRFGELTHPKTKYLLSGVVAGIGGYGNCVGVPTVGGECKFDKSYNGNILVNAMSVGLASKDKIFYSSANFVGSMVVYVGSKTGRDGIHGATMASTEFDDKSAEKRPTVQVGDPFAEKLLIEACLELMAGDAILSIQDMGAAGLTSSSLEMAGKGGTGIELDLSLVPIREENMTPYEIMLSESQERMLIVLKPEKAEVAQAIFAKWRLEFAVIGRITEGGKMILKFNQEIVADLPIDPLISEAPLLDRESTPTAPRDILQPTSLTFNHDINKALLQLLSSPDLCSKRWIWEQFDSKVMNDTIAASGGDAAIVRIHDSNKALAMAIDCTARYCFADPVEGGKQAVAESWRNLTATGAVPLAITNCLNFGNPEKKEIMGQIVGCLQGIGEACRALNYPVVSGNASLYNETNSVAILPTPTIGGVGLIANIDLIIKNNLLQEQDVILLVGPTLGHLGASIYLRDIVGRSDSAPPPVDLILEKLNGDFVRSLIVSQLLSSCHDLSDGGLYVAIASIAIKYNMGADLTVDEPGVPLTAFMFGEDQARYLLTCSVKQVDNIIAQASKLGVVITKIGTMGGRDIVLNKQHNIAVDALKNSFENTIPDFMRKSI
jgi:phosphoribosylformylglycinamidine synthase